MNLYQCIIGGARPEFIPIADKPLRLGGKVESIAVEEFEKRLGIEYFEGISIDMGTKISPFRENITGNVPASVLKKQIPKVLKNPWDDLVVCKMGNLGHGIFASKDKPKDTVIAIYSGTIICETKFANREDQAMLYYGTNMAFCTKHHRGISSLMQHLPEEPKLPDAKTMSKVLKMIGQEVSEDELMLNEEFFSTEFSPAKTKSLVAVQNVRWEYLEYNNTPVIAMVTNLNIKSGDQLGFNYGYPYWSSRNVTPEFFDKDGCILAHELYKRTFGQLHFDGFSCTGPYKRLINSIKQGQTSITVIDDDKKPHTVTIDKLISLLVKANAAAETALIQLTLPSKDEK